MSVDQVLDKARVRERAYDWSKAAECYNEALGLISEPTGLAKAALSEDLAYATYRWARQAENRPEFEARMKIALRSYHVGRQFYLRLGQAQESPRSLRCDAVIAFLGFWMASDPVEKKRLLDEAWKLTRRALKGFEEAQEPVECARTFDQLSRGAILRVEFEWSFPARKKMIREFVRDGEKMLTLVTALEDSYQFAKTTAGVAVCFAYFADLLLGLEEGQSLERRALDCWLRAKKLNEKLALLEMADLGFGPERGDANEADWLNALEHARESHDNLLQGWALDMLAFWGETRGQGYLGEDPEEMARKSARVLEFGKESVRHYSIINFTSPLPSDTWLGDHSPDHYFLLSYCEADLKKKRVLLEKSLGLSPAAINKALKSGYPTIIMWQHHWFSATLDALAHLEHNRGKKERLLKDALRHITAWKRIGDQIFPFNPENQGTSYVMHSYMKADLAELSEDTKIKKRLLQEAATEINMGLKLRVRALPFLEKYGLLGEYPYLGGIHAKGGNILNALHSVTKNPEDLREAIDNYRNAADFYHKADLLSHEAESYWRIALAQDALDENRKASESFQIASDCYKSAAQKISQFREFYLDYSRFMRAWKEVEKARYYQVRQEYDLAKASYKSASRTLQSTSRWSYLASNYSAWAGLEDAENLSRHERIQEAIIAFRRAASRFKVCRQSLKLALPRIESEEEERLAVNLQRASQQREAYCNARMRIEEAKQSDRKGEHDASLQGYSDAVEMLRNFIVGLEYRESREIKLILTLTEAWQIMARAEEEISPMRFLEASRYFEKAKQLATNERTRMLISGHVHLCRAMHASTKFADTGKTALYSSAARQLESAGRCYIQADFKIAASFSKATEQLLDAYLQMNRAKTEPEPEKKARLYLMAERLLREAAKNYDVGGEFARRERVERLLEETIEKRELAVSLSALLQAPTVLSTTAAFSSLGATQEKAVGLNGFEHASLQARIICDKRTLKKDDHLEMSLELANGGKALAQLVRWDDAVPAGFELAEESEDLRLADKTLDLKGRALAPLKTYSVRLILRAANEGIFTLQPRIVYVDDRGVSRTNSPEPIEIIVSPILEYLVIGYREDYSQRKLPSDEAGWRTLMDIVESQGLSRNQVYGDARRGRSFGKPLENLVEQELVEVRIFPGERGRGGRVLKVRVNYPRERARKLLKISAMPT